MNKMLLTISGVVFLFIAGCATTGHGHETACAKCSCKMMRSDATDSSKCAMCGHGAADHKHDKGAKAESSEHKH